jgi:hypothetical protein
MKPEDYELVIFRGKRLRRVPELTDDAPGESRCDMCLLRDRDCSELNSSAMDQLNLDSETGGCGDTSVIYLPEEDFQEYVVELVRRRVS